MSRVFTLFPEMTHPQGWISAPLFLPSPSCQSSSEEAVHGGPGQVTPLQDWASDGLLGQKPQAGDFGREEGVYDEDHGFGARMQIQLNLSFSTPEVQEKKAGAII